MSSRGNFFLRKSKQPYFKITAFSSMVIVRIENDKTHTTETDNNRKEKKRKSEKSKNKLIEIRIATTNELIIIGKPIWVCLYCISKILNKLQWTGRDLNSQPPQCECGALPIMLPAHNFPFVPLEGLEPPTDGFGGHCSIQLSYKGKTLKKTSLLYQLQCDRSRMA